MLREANTDSVYDFCDEDGCDGILYLDNDVSSFHRKTRQVKNAYLSSLTRHSRYTKNRVSWEDDKGYWDVRIGRG